jgi:hypothetical protein
LEKEIMTKSYEKRYKYISDGTWFKKGTEAYCLWTHEALIESGFAVFQGIRADETGKEYIDEETSTIDEFEVIPL